MPLSSSSVAPPLPAERNVARSRSRYKGPRLHKAPTDSSGHPTFGREQVQRQHNFPVSEREPRSQYDTEERRRFHIDPTCHEALQRHRGFTDDAQTPDASLVQLRGNLTKASDFTELEDKLFSQSQTLQGCQQKHQFRKHYAQAEPHEGAGQGSMPGRKAAASSVQGSPYPGLDLHCPKIERADATIESLTFPRTGLNRHTTRNSKARHLHPGSEELKRMISAPIPTEPAQDVVKPHFDAPVSAVNAGERRVRVRLDQNVVLLPVTPSTTPLDIIRSAADQLSESLDPNGTNLLESFKLLGLERPLRRYEHVRDVLNSWSHDTQNTLLIKPSSPGGRGDWLNFHSVSTSQPAEKDTTVYIHYSQRPGHWDKRWVTLRSDGQMLVAKREGRETVNICHMSDFDVYIPTVRQLAKRIKPPRKICFAVKSQQKSSIFLNTANFVHFFSTSDKTLATTWFKAVREWRNWYLVNVMGKGEEGLQSLKRLSMKVDGQNISNTLSESQRQPSGGIESTRDLSSDNHHTEQLTPFTNITSGHNSVEYPVGNMLLCSRSKMQSSQSKNLSTDANLDAPEQRSPPIMQVVPPKESEPFAVTGLLGRTYTQRQKAQGEREKARTAHIDQLAATRNVDRISRLDRALSQRQKPKPLIDLTPQYQEPPQHAKKGRGVILEQIPAGGLVEVANTPETAIAIPPSTTWRRPISKVGDGPNATLSKSVQQDHSSSTKF